MTLTDEEKKIARAYHLGVVLNTYEPRLMNKIIKGNGKNEFVKAMQVGRDHQEFNANIPRPDYTPEFKNGFFNGRTLAEHNPKLVALLLVSKGVSKDYKRGLESAQKEFSIKMIQKKMDMLPKVPVLELRKDENFQKGYRVGYRLAETHASSLKVAHLVNDKYSKFIEGIKTGKEQYEFELTGRLEKGQEPKVPLKGSQQLPLERAIVENKIVALNDISNVQSRLIERNEGFENVIMPIWLQKKAPDKAKPDLKKDKNIDLDR